MCAEHHCDIGLCGCDADDQYARAQASKRTMTLTLTTEERAALDAMIDADEPPTWKMIADLRREEGGSITLLCDNPEAWGPNNAIEVCGAWTDWQDRRFEGESLKAAILAAWRASREATARKDER
jgi:hypothetical protein